jgi:hypothetical protein
MGANATTSVPSYTSGEVLTAANLSVTNSGIPVFATTVTRDAAFGGTGEKVLAEGQFAYIEATNTTQYYDGAAWQSVAAARQFAVFNESQASGTNGGTATSGSWFKRVLNTTVTNGITGCTLTSSVISLPAGSYVATVIAPNYRTDESQFRLQNTTAGTTIIYGGSNNARNSSSQTMIGTVQAFFTLAVTSNIEVQNQVLTTINTVGLGLADSFGGEVYASIQIEKVA